MDISSKSSDIIYIIYHMFIYIYIYMTDEQTMIYISIKYHA